jgi:hypothetical protein
MEYNTRTVEQRRNGDDAREPHHGRKAGADEKGSGSHKEKTGAVQRDIDVLAVMFFASRLAVGRHLRVVPKGSSHEWGLRRGRRRRLDGYACRPCLRHCRRQRRHFSQGRCRCQRAREIGERNRSRRRRPACRRRSSCRRRDVGKRPRRLAAACTQLPRCLELGNGIKPALEMTGAVPRLIRSVPPQPDTSGADRSAQFTQ